MSRGVGGRGEGYGKFAGASKIIATRRGAPKSVPSDEGGLEKK